ncbi:MAG TPA: hypothetical protein VL588_08755 [Bdellovibrionota bacterium]|nr:hypothetical protein [Bdellovibrionota bacterium]
MRKSIWTAGLSLALLAGSAHADSALTIAFKNCTAYATTAYSHAEWSWDASAPETLPAAGGTCKRDAWGSYVSTSSDITSSTMDWTKIPLDGSGDSLLGFHCYNDRAQALFEAMNRYADQSEGTWSGGDYVITRRDGQLNCNRRIRNSDGSETNYYWCNILLDVSSYFVKALDL